jgi:site-specific recombinase
MLPRGIREHVLDERALDVRVAAALAAMEQCELAFQRRVGVPQCRSRAQRIAKRERSAPSSATVAHHVDQVRARRAAPKNEVLRNAGMRRIVVAEGRQRG